MKNIKDTLIKKVFKWGIARDLYKYSSVPVQLVKLAEEFFEYEEAVEEHDFNGIRDAQGDILIVVLNMFGVSEFKKSGSLNADELVHRINNFKPLCDLDKCKNKTLREVISEYTKKIIRGKTDPAELFYALSLSFSPYGDSYASDVLSEAYEVIKDRKGKLTPDGNFVKSEDLQKKSNIRYYNQSTLYYKKSTLSLIDRINQVRSHTCIRLENLKNDRNILKSLGFFLVPSKKSSTDFQLKYWVSLVLLSPRRVFFNLFLDPRDREQNMKDFKVKYRNSLKISKKLFIFELKKKAYISYYNYRKEGGYKDFKLIVAECLSDIEKLKAKGGLK